MNAHNNKKTMIRDPSSVEDEEDDGGLPGLVSVTAHKSNPKEPIGIVLRRLGPCPDDEETDGKNKGCIIIDTIQSNSIFRNHKELRPGMIVLKINGQDCSDDDNNNSDGSNPYASIKQANKLLKQLSGRRCGGNITIVATTFQQHQKDMLAEEERRTNTHHNNNHATRSQMAVRFAPGTKTTTTIPENSQMMAHPSSLAFHSTVSNDFSRYNYSLDAPPGLRGSSGNNNKAIRGMAANEHCCSSKGMIHHQQYRRNHASNTALSQFQSTISDITIDSYLIHPYKEIDVRCGEGSSTGTREEEKKMEHWYANDHHHHPTPKPPPPRPTPNRNGMISMGDLQVNLPKRAAQGGPGTTPGTTLDSDTTSDSYSTPLRSGSCPLTPIPQGGSSSSSGSNSSPLSSQDLQLLISSHGGGGGGIVVVDGDEYAGISQDDIHAALAAEDSVTLQKQRRGSEERLKIQSVRRRSSTSTDPPTKGAHKQQEMMEAAANDGAHDCLAAQGTKVVDFVDDDLPNHLPPPGVAPGGHWGSGHCCRRRHSHRGGGGNNLFTLLGCASSILSRKKKKKKKKKKTTEEEVELYRDPDGIVYDIEGYRIGSEDSTKFQYNNPGNIPADSKTPKQTITEQEYSVGYSC